VGVQSIFRNRTQENGCGKQYPMGFHFWPQGPQHGLISSGFPFKERLEALTAPGTGIWGGVVPWIGTILHLMGGVIF